MDSIEWLCSVCDADNSICGCEAKDHFQKQLADSQAEVKALKEWAKDSQEWMLGAETVLSSYDEDGRILASLISRVYKLLTPTEPKEG